MNAVVQKSFLIFLLALSLVSCNKDSNVDPIDESFNPEDPIIEDARALAKKLYNDLYLESAVTDDMTPWTGSATSCNPGTVPQATRDKILMRLDYFRKAVGLHNEILENGIKNDKAQRAALMMHANSTLDHSPPNTWKCFSQEGKEGASNSLLTMIHNERAIDSYMRDHGASNGPVGHRRWLLWPRLQEIGIGNTSRTNAIWVLGNAGAVPENMPDFISWPPKGHIPNNLVYPRWSFSIRDANFQNTKVSMTDESGNSIPLYQEKLDNAYGDRTIVWVPEGIQTNNTHDTPYTVTLKEVAIDGVLEDFTYTVILFDPSE
ncbi:MAG: CAP domain-containing protein [Bacteroidota bacterium]